MLVKVQLLHEYVLLVPPSTCMAPPEGCAVVLRKLLLVFIKLHAVHKYPIWWPSRTSTLPP